MGNCSVGTPEPNALFGYQSTEIIGQHFSRFFTPEDIVTGQPEHELKTALADGRADSNCWQVRKDGTRFWCQAIVTPLLDENKQARSFAGVMHDLTESEAVQAQRKRADGLAEANRSKEEFMALLSHELRSPLSPILNALEHSAADEDRTIRSSSKPETSSTVKSGVMVRLVDDLLDITRITKGKLRLTKEQVELRVVVNHAAETVRPFMDARKHDFSVSLPTEPIWVEADPARMEQVVVNLLNNAAKYTDTGGLIRMTVSQEGDEAVIRVRDNGVGIAPELLPHIFELFTQVDGSLGRSYGGLGIGLALARHLVEMHEGRLQASSAGLGKGCEFTIKLPVLLTPSLRETKTSLGAGPSIRDDRCVCWWWRITSMPATPWACCCGFTATKSNWLVPAQPRWKWLRLLGPTWCCWTSACREWMAMRLQSDCESGRNSRT